MGKSSRLKALRRATKFVTRIGYCDGTEQFDGFASREAARKMVDVVRPLLDEPEGVDLIELVECSSGAVEYRAVREAGL